MTTIVPTSEDDLVIAVVRFTSELAWADAGPEVAEPQVARLCIEAQECMVMGRWVDLVSLMLTSAGLITSRVSEKDFECTFTVICTLATRAGSPDEALEMAKIISTKIIQQPNDKPALRMKILFNLYNLLEDPYSRFLVYTKALTLAANGKVTESIIPSFKLIDSFLQEWNIGKEDQRELFLAISNILKDSKSTCKESFVILSKYLTTFSTEEALAMNEEKEEAVRAIIEFVKSPDIFECDLLNMPAIAQLEKDESYASVYQLLEVFLTGLVHEECITKMRLMSLIDLSCNESGEIPYAEVVEALRIKDDEVEGWVVKAIMSNVLDCKMDQMNQVVLVSRRTERLFGISRWQALRSKLWNWRANVASAISIIQSSKVADEGVQGMQEFVSSW